MLYANIIVDISHEKLDKCFQYRVPESLEKQIEVGMQVRIPFGKGNRIIDGFVIELTDKTEYDHEKIKDLIDIKKGSLKVESQLIALAWWMKREYGSSMNKALKTVIPVKQQVKGNEKRFIGLNVDRKKAKELLDYYGLKKNTQGRKRLLEYLLEKEIIEEGVIVNDKGISKAIIKALEEKRIIRITKKSEYRKPVIYDKTLDDKRIELNEEQKMAVEEILSDKKTPHLLFGVTGSGKTEVYMELIDRVISDGKEVIVLIPEIALTYQTIRRFYQKFGELVTVINSKMSQGERYDQFERAKASEVKVMIGPRSALFTPFSNLGLIIIDEEHENAYKSDQVPKYHARQTALKRAELSDAYVVFGSATPSVESYYNYQKGKYKLHRLINRANSKALPEVHVVDMRQELESGNRSFISDELKKLLIDRLNKNEQSMLFINRRGYSSFVSCRACGEAIKCPHCDVTLTFHKKRNSDIGRLVCHYCGYGMDMPKLCPKCQSRYLGRFGLGTEQLEEKIREIMPNARILRMDFDTTREKGNYEQILSEFAKHNADILVGTQMIVKGHDFRDVTLVGVIAADLSLYTSDYMATERTFELLTQAAGRAGRGELKGEVVIQTYNPAEQCIVDAVNQDYESFYEKEIGFRTLMDYPPVCNMCAILVLDKSDEKALLTIKDISNRIEKSYIEGLMVIGPCQAAVSKINDVYRYVVYLKHRDMEELIKLKDRVMTYINMRQEYKNMSIYFDFTPQNNY